VNSLPTKASVLSSIEGVGRKTVEKYGNEILNIITSFVKDNNLAYINKKEEKRQGFSETYFQEFIFKLFSSGKSIQEIAIESRRSENIVFNELSSYVLAHKIPLTSIVSKEQLKSITDAVLILPAGCSLNDVRKHCLTGITDDQIKLVMRVMKCI